MDPTPASAQVDPAEEQGPHGTRPPVTGEAGSSPQPLHQQPPPQPPPQQQQQAQQHQIWHYGTPLAVTINGGTARTAPSAADRNAANKAAELQQGITQLDANNNGSWQSANGATVFSASCSTYVDVVRDAEERLMTPVPRSDFLTPKASPNLEPEPEPEPEPQPEPQPEAHPADFVDWSTAGWSRAAAGEITQQRQLEETARISAATGPVQSLLRSVSDQLAQLAVAKSDDVREAESRKQNRLLHAVQIQESEGELDRLRAASALRGQSDASERFQAMRSELGDPPYIKRKTRLDVIASGGNTSTVD